MSQLHRIRSFYLKSGKLFISIFRKKMVVSMGHASDGKKVDLITWTIINL